MERDWNSPLYRLSNKNRTAAIIGDAKVATTEFKCISWAQQWHFWFAQKCLVRAWRTLSNLLARTTRNTMENHFRQFEYRGLFWNSTITPSSPRTSAFDQQVVQLNCIFWMSRISYCRHYSLCWIVQDGACIFISLTAIETIVEH